MLRAVGRGIRSVSKAHQNHRLKGAGENLLPFVTPPKIDNSAKGTGGMSCAFCVHENSIKYASSDHSEGAFFVSYFSTREEKLCG